MRSKSTLVITLGVVVAVTATYATRSGTAEHNIDSQEILPFFETCVPALDQSHEIILPAFRLEEHGETTEYYSESGSSKFTLIESDDRTSCTMELRSAGVWQEQPDITQAVEMIETLISEWVSRPDDPFIDRGSNSAVIWAFDGQRRAFMLSLAPPTSTYTASISYVRFAP